MTNKACNGPISDLTKTFTPWCGWGIKTKERVLFGNKLAAKRYEELVLLLFAVLFPGTRLLQLARPHLVDSLK